MWKTVSEFDGYEVSDLGEVRNKKTRHVLKPWVGTGGYLYIAFSVNGTGHTKRLHRIVAEEFCKRTDNKNQINHKDGNKRNNTANNLEWCSQSENMVHAYQTGLQKCVGNHPVHKVVCVTDGRVFRTIREASEFYGINRNKIRACCDRKSTRSNDGLLFRFYNERRDDDTD